MPDQERKKISKMTDREILEELLITARAAVDSVEAMTSASAFGVMDPMQVLQSRG